MFDKLRAYMKKRSVELHPADGNTPLPVISAIVDANTRVVLMVSEHIAAMSFVAGTFMDTYHALNVGWPNHMRGIPFSLSSRSFEQWTYNLVARRFEPTRPDVITPELRAQSVLAVRRHWAAAHVMRVLSVARSRYESGIPLQETVYMTKKLQAQAFSASGYDESRVFEYPYVMQYADFADLSYREAADEIVLKAKLADDFLAKTELLRLTYLNALKNITDINDIKPLLEAFERESFSNSFV